MSDVTSTAEWAVRYIETYRFALVAILAGAKGPVDQGWTRPGGYVKDAEAARLRWSNGTALGIGVVLGPSGLCSADIDSPELAEPVLSELGIDLRALRKSTPTIQGNPARYRMMFKAPHGVVLGRKALVWPPKNPGEKPITLFELRAGDVQDLLPPSVHPGTGKPYVWLIPPNSVFPPLPEDVLELWLNWGSYRKELEGMCPWTSHGFKPEPAPRGAGARPNVIAAFNQAHSVEELLGEHGYTPRGNRWVSPTSSTGLAGVAVLDGRVYSHHASDPLADGHAHDVFDVWRILDHGGDARAAVKAAAHGLGMAVREAIAGAKAPARDEPRSDNGAAPGHSEHVDDGLASTEASRLRAVETFIQSDDPTKPSRLRPQTDILIDIGLKGSTALFCGDDDRAYAVIRDVCEVWPIASRRFREWLRGCYFKLITKGANANSVRDAIETISSHAQFSGDKRKVFLRTAEADGKLYIDLTDDQWRVVEIDTDGWRVLERSPIMFARRGAPTPLPAPVSGGTLSELWPLLNVPDEARPLVAAWVLAALYPFGPYPILMFQGEEGTAKSTAARMLRALCDPSLVPLRAPTRDEKDFLVGAVGNWCVCVDNASDLQPWLSDALCRLSTGGAFAARTLYTDCDEIAISIQRPVILNGIDVAAYRGDLVSRTITVCLGVISEDRKRSEAELWARFRGVQPRVLGALMTALSQAVRDLPNVALTRHPRMADFARLAVAAETALGFDPGEFMAAYSKNLDAGAQTTLESSIVAQALIAFMTARKGVPGCGEWTGTATELLDAIAPKADDHSTRSASAWPKSGRGMVAALTRLAQALRRLGIEVEHVERASHHQPRLVHLMYEVPAGRAQQAQRAPSAWNAGPTGPVGADGADPTRLDAPNGPQHAPENYNEVNAGADGARWARPAGTSHASPDGEPTPEDMAHPDGEPDRIEVEHLERKGAKGRRMCLVWKVPAQPSRQTLPSEPSCDAGCGGVAFSNPPYTGGEQGIETETWAAYKAQGERGDRSTTHGGEGGRQNYLHPAKVPTAPDLATAGGAVGPPNRAGQQSAQFGAVGAVEGNDSTCQHCSGEGCDWCGDMGRIVDDEPEKTRA